MYPSLQQHIKRFIAISDDELAAIAVYFKEIPLSKKENLLTGGKVCAANYFVVNGCLRLFFINDKGVEQTTQFALENWWLADYHSFATQTVSGFNIQAIERSTVLALGYAAQEELLQRFPIMERYFRLIHQRAHAASQFRIKIMYALTREELYHQFNKLEPAFVQRIPQYLLASYLGFTPEYLSEIRARK